MNFSNVAVGQQVTQNATLTNTGRATVSVTQINVSSPSFSTSGVALPMSIAPGQSAALIVAFKRSASGAEAGSLTVTTSKGESSTDVSLNAGSVSSPSQLTVSSPSLSFGNVLVHGSSTQAITLLNSGASQLHISSITIAGAAFSSSGVIAPVTLLPGQAAVLQTTFSPVAPGAAVGSVTIASDASTPSSTVALSGTGVSGTYSMSVTPSAVSFGNVAAGTTATRTVQLTNTGTGNFTVTSVAASGTGVSVSGLSSPVTLAPSQSLSLTVSYTPSGGGAVTGSVTITNSDGVNTVASVTGDGIQAGLGVTPASATFGSVITGSTSTAQTIQLRNTGSANLTISSASLSGAGFTASGLIFPLTLAPGQTANLNVQYAPTSAGATAGSIAFTSNAPGSPVVSLSGTGVAASYAMSLSASSVNFGSVNTGGSTSKTLTLTNTGNSNVSITQVSATGTGMSITGLAAGATLAPAQSVSLNVIYAPTSTGTASGSLSITNNQGVSVAAALSGTGVQAGFSVTPASAAFGSVVVGNANSQTFQVTNTGSANLTISSATVIGTGFTFSGMGLPVSLTPGQSASFNVQYAPASAGSVTGTVSITSNASSTPATVAVSGTGVAATRTLSFNPASLSFGSVNDGTTASQGFTVTNTGNSNVSITGVSASGNGFSILSGSGALTLAPTQSTSVNVQFAPSTAGSATGSVIITSNAIGSSTVALSGTGVAPTTPHSVGLSWGSSSSTVNGYNVYRSTVSGSSYSKVNTSLLSGLTFSDTAVTAGQTYYYVATAVDATGNESAFSNEVSSTVP